MSLPPGTVSNWEQGQVPARSPSWAGPTLVSPAGSMVLNRSCYFSKPQFPHLDRDHLPPSLVFGFKWTLEGRAPLWWRPPPASGHAQPAFSVSGEWRRVYCEASLSCSCLDPTEKEKREKASQEGGDVPGTRRDSTPSLKTRESWALSLPSAQASSPGLMLNQQHTSLVSSSCAHPVCPYVYAQVYTCSVCFRAW